MNYAIISDIHSDIHSLKNVLASIKKLMIDKIICLGDIVGYGSQPEEVVGEMIQQKIVCIKGNHEKALFSTEAFDFMNDKAKDAIDENFFNLSDDSLEFLKSLPDYWIENNIRFVHGVPPKSVYEYLNHCLKEEIISFSKQYSEIIAFCGHSHLTEIVEIKDNKVCRNENIKFDKVYNLDIKHRYIINVGSVSLQRDNDISGSIFTVFDSNSYKLRFIKS